MLYRSLKKLFSASVLALFLSVSIVVPAREAKAASMVEYALLVNLITSYYSKGLAAFVPIKGVACDFDGTTKKVTCFDGNDRPVSGFNPMLRSFEKAAEAAFFSCESGQLMCDALNSQKVTYQTAIANAQADMTKKCEKDPASADCSLAKYNYIATQILAYKHSRFALGYCTGTTFECVAQQI